MPAQGVERRDGRLLVRQADVDVERGLRGSAQQAAHLVRDALVAARRHEVGLTHAARRVETTPEEHRPGGGRLRAERGERVGRLADGRRGRRAKLELRRVRLVPGGARVDLHRTEHRARDRRESTRLPVDEQELLLDPDRVLAR